MRESFLSRTDLSSTEFFQWTGKEILYNPEFVNQTIKASNIFLVTISYVIFILPLIIPLFFMEAKGHVGGMMILFSPLILLICLNLVSYTLYINTYKNFTEKLRIKSGFLAIFNGLDNQLKFFLSLAIATIYLKFMVMGIFVLFLFIDELNPLWSLLIYVFQIHILILLKTQYTKIWGILGLTRGLEKFNRYQFMNKTNLFLKRFS